LIGAEFIYDGLGVIDQRCVVVERDDADLVGREPEREVARVIFDEAADEPFVACRAARGGCKAAS